MSNSQEVQSNLGQGLIIIGMRIVTIVRTGKVKQESFHVNFADGAHSGEGDWVDQSDSPENLRKRESFWQHELDTFQLNSSNELEVTLC